MDQQSQHQDEGKSYLISQSSFESNLEEFLHTLEGREDDAELWGAQLHEAVVIELPFAAKTNLPTRLSGKADCLEFIRRWYNLFADFSLYDVKVHRLEEPKSYILEYKTKGFVAGTAKPYHQENIAVVKVKDHKIAFIREYWNPVQLLEAFGEDFSLRKKLNFMDVKSIDPF